jgi:hypothetical protein
MANKMSVVIATLIEKFYVLVILLSLNGFPLFCEGDLYKDKQFGFSHCCQL